MQQLRHGRDVLPISPPVRSKPPPMCMTCYPSDVDPGTNTARHGQVRWWSGSRQHHRNERVNQPAGPVMMTATGNVYRWNPDSRAWSSERTQTGVVAR